MTRTYKTLILLLILSAIFSCYKKKDIYYTGVVYSKHHYPMQNLSVNFGYSKGNDRGERAGFIETTTDSNGRFVLQKKIQGNYYIESISIHCDSGFYQNDAYNNLEIILN